MVFKHFRTHLVLRIIGIIITIGLLFYLLFSHHFNITPILLLIVIILQVVSLIKYLERTNRYLTTFLESIRYSDFTRSFQIQGLGSAYDGLKDAFNNVIEDFQKIRAEKQANYHYLQNVIQHIGIALIAFKPNGEVILVNNAAKKLFRIFKIRNIADLNQFSEGLAKLLPKMKSGQKDLIKVQIEDDFLQLVVSAKEFILGGLNVSLVSIQNIQAELETQELEAWQKLIRVLTHEIMNSITPISSLSATVNSMLDGIDTTDNKPQEIDDETVIDIQDALRTIHRRSNGLIHFVETYRNLTKIPKPDFTIFPLKQLLDNVENLMKDQMEKSNIDFSISLEPDTLYLTADEELIEQIIINLLKNSIQAMGNQEKKVISIKAYIGLRGRILIQVIDNGPGILQDVIDKIFIPFFTTKSNGSGIGLSLSRQIMRMHGGTITVASELDKETVFTLRF